LRPRSRHSDRRHGLLPQHRSTLRCDARFAYVMPNFQNPTGRTLTISAAPTGRGRAQT